jgi:uncharacterized protein (TIGR03067 family)
MPIGPAGTPELVPGFGTPLIARCLPREVREMRVVAVLLLLCTNVQCNSTKQEMSAMNDSDRIQGSWALVSGERHGEKFSDKVVQQVKLTFAGDTLKTRQNNNVTEARFILHPETNPKGIDLDMDGSLGLGIYKLEGHTLTILHGEIEEPRPANFDAVKGRNLTMLVLQKVSE